MTLPRSPRRHRPRPPSSPAISTRQSSLSLLSLLSMTQSKASVCFASLPLTHMFHSFLILFVLNRHCIGCPQEVHALAPKCDRINPYCTSSAFNSDRSSFNAQCPTAPQSIALL
eukprot:57862_1